jgi:hypothetical protein
MTRIPQSSPEVKHLVTGLVQRAIGRNQLYALAVLPPAIFLITGHVVLGLLFVLCVVGGRLSRPRPQRP